MMKKRKRMIASMLMAIILVANIGVVAYADTTETEIESETETETERETETEDPEPIVLKAVTNLTAVGIGERTVKLQWDAVEGADGYIIHRQIGKTSFEYLVDVVDTIYTDTSASETEYNYYRVYPYYMNGEEKVMGPSDTYVYAKGRFDKGWHWIGGYKRYVKDNGEIDNDVSRLVTGPYLIKVYKEGNYLIIFAKDENGKYIRRERYYGNCSRSFYVGKDVEQTDIKARFEDGILKVFVPKKETKPAVEEKKYITIEG